TLVDSVSARLPDDARHLLFGSDRARAGGSPVPGLAAMTQWTFLLVGYVLSVLVECPVLLVGLSPRHSLTVKLFASFWLTACTYPIVILSMPVIFPDHHVLASEIFAAVDRKS